MSILQQIIASLTAIIVSLSGQVANITNSTSPHSQIAAVAPVSGLVGHWKFDEGSGSTTSDSSGSGNLGTLINSPSWVSGKVGGAVDFNGVDQRVNLAADPIGANTVSVCAWVKPSSSTSVFNNFIYNHNFTLSSYNSHTKYLVSSNGVNTYFQSVASPTIGVWQHLCVVRQSDGAGSLYINGSLDSTGQTGTPSVSSYGLAIGDNQLNEGPYKGSIDEVRIYSRALSAQEIADIYTVDTGSEPTSTPTTTTTTQTTTTTTVTPTPVTTTTVTPSPIPTAPTPIDSSGVLPVDRSINWAMAGIPGGIPSASWVNCSTTACNAVATPSGSNDTAKIQAAIDSAPAQSVVKLGNGTYISNGMIWMKNNVSIRGNGPGNTIINYAGPKMATNNDSAQILFEVNANSSDEQVEWQGRPTFNITGGVQKNSSSLNLSSALGITIGSVLHLTQLDDTSLVSSGGYCGYEGNREIGQYVEVTAVSGNTVSIYPSLYMPYNLSLSPTARLVSPTALVKRAGLENLTLTQTGDLVSDNIIMRGAQQSWIKNVEIKSVGVWFGGIRIDDSFQNEIRNNFIHETPAAPDHSRIGIMINRWSSANRIENNIFDNISEAELMMNNSGGNVLAYNYLTNNIRFPGYEHWMSANPSMNHCAHPVQNLWESNVGNKFEADITHGSSSHNVVFRNRALGYDSLYPDTTLAMYAVDLAAHNKHYSIIGNILGTSGKSDVYELTSTTGYIPGRRYIWAFGVTEGISDPTVAQTTIRWGNYDYVTNRTHWGALTGDSTEVPAGISLSQSLPASLYRSSSPTWWATPWGTPSWPAIGPDVSGLISKIPAQRCFENQNLHNGGVFNPSVCYPNDTVTSSAPAPTPSPTPEPTPEPIPSSTKFSVGQRVQTTSNLNVRSTASASGVLVGTQPLGAIGTIVNGGQSVDGYYWWNVNFDSGADGYSVESYLADYIAPVPTPTPEPAPTPTSTPTQTPTSTPTTYIEYITRTLKKGSSGTQVGHLQRALIIEGLLLSKYKTNYFGSVTETALKAFQKKYGIVSSGTPNTTGYGATGPLTRAKLNEILNK